MGFFNSTKPLGRRPSPSDDHIRKYFITRPEAGTLEVERTLSLPYWHWFHDQGSEGACVGFGTAMERAIREKHERKLRRQRPATVRFNPWWIWDQAKSVDEWTDTNPGDANGTSVNAAYRIMRERGAVRSLHVGDYPGAAGVADLLPDTQFGVRENRWATTVDEIRACIARNQPVTIGVNWYSNFDHPEKVGRDWFIGRGTNLGHIRGGHCVCIYGASDRRQAFKIKNSWGHSYPLVYLPYTTMFKLLFEDGEATVVTDDD